MWQTVWVMFLVEGRAVFVENMGSFLRFFHPTHNKMAGRPSRPLLTSGGRRDTGKSITATLPTGELGRLVDFCRAFWEKLVFIIAARPGRSPPPGPRTAIRPRQRDRLMICEVRGSGGGLRIIFSMIFSIGGFERS